MYFFNRNKSFKKTYKCKGGWELIMDDTGVSYTLWTPQGINIATVTNRPHELAKALGYKGPMPVFEPEND